MQIRVVYLLLLIGLVAGGVAYSMLGGDGLSGGGERFSSPEFSPLEKSGEPRILSRRPFEREPESRPMPMVLVIFGAFLAGALFMVILGWLFRSKPKPQPAAPPEAPVRRRGGMMNRLVVPGAGGIAAVSTTWDLQQAVIAWGGTEIGLASVGATALVGILLASSGVRF